MGLTDRVSALIQDKSSQKSKMCYITNTNKEIFIRYAILLHEHRHKSHYGDSPSFQRPM